MTQTSRLEDRVLTVLTQPPPAVPAHLSPARLLSADDQRRYQQLVDKVAEGELGLIISHLPPGGRIFRRPYLGGRPEHAPQPLASVLMCAVSALPRPSSLCQTSPVPPGDTLLLLDACHRLLDTTNEQVQKVAFYAMFGPIRSQLAVVETADWEGRGPGGSLSADLPDFSYTPQEYITQVRETFLRRAWLQLHPTGVHNTGERHVPQTCPTSATPHRSTSHR